jgi:aryl carrier-like protein
MPENGLNAPLTPDQLRQAVTAIIGLESDDIPADANLVDLGIDSMGVMLLIRRWREQGIRVSYRELVANPTLAAWQQHLDGHARRP